MLLPYGVHAITIYYHLLPSFPIHYLISPSFFDNQYCWYSHAISNGSDRLALAAGDLSEFMMRFALDRCLDARSALKLGAAAPGNPKTRRKKAWDKGCKHQYHQ